LVGLLVLLSIFAFNVSWIYFFEPGLLSVIILSIIVLIIFN
jgi:hypothetical protein